MAVIAVCRILVLGPGAKNFWVFSNFGGLISDRFSIAKLVEKSLSIWQAMRHLIAVSFFHGMLSRREKKKTWYRIMCETTSHSHLADGWSALIFVLISCLQARICKIRSLSTMVWRSSWWIIRASLPCNRNQVNLVVPPKVIHPLWVQK